MVLGLNGYGDWKSKIQKDVVFESFINISTLERRVKGLNKVFKGNEKGLGSRNKTFPPEIENNLVEYIQKWKECFMGSLHKILGHWNFS